jgi:hypothetical protein
VLPVSQLPCADCACVTWAHLFTLKINNNHGRRLHVSREKKGIK